MNDKMDDGEVELSDQFLGPKSDSSVSVDTFLHELLRNAQTCTHTHTCNPPGPDAAHTHTCYHTHTQVISSEKADNDPSDSKNLVSKSRRPSGNREAVRKYREKKKAHTAYLEEEVKKLRFVNQQLIRKVRRQAILEAEISRLRRLFLDLRGNIDNALGVYSLQKQCSSGTAMKEGDCRMQYSDMALMRRCESESNCFQPQGGSSTQCGDGGGDGGCEKMGDSYKRNCQSAIVDCQAKGNSTEAAERSSLDSMETMLLSASQAD